jgi:hypothetical protein
MSAIGQHARRGTDGARPIARAGAIGGADIQRHAGHAKASASVMGASAKEGMRRGEGDGGCHGRVSRFCVAEYVRICASKGALSLSCGSKKGGFEGRPARQDSFFGMMLPVLGLSIV